MREGDGEHKPPPIKLEVDVDSRMADAWGLLWRSQLYEILDDNMRADLAKFVRGAYLMGYRDALNDSGSLLDDTGVTLI